MALGFEGSKGILIKKEEYEKQRKGNDVAVGFEGSKGILINSAIKPRKEFQEAVFLGAKGMISWDEFISRIQILPPRMSVSAFANNQCSLGCRHCYLRNRKTESKDLPSESDISGVSNHLHAVDFSIVGMEPLETWKRTKNILELVHAKNKAIITNGVHLSDTIASYLSENQISVDFSVGEEKNYAMSLSVAKKFAATNVKATASCIVIANGVDPCKIIDDIANLGLPLIFFSCCEPSGKSESDTLILNLIESLMRRNLQTKTMVKVDFLSPILLNAVWKRYLSDSNFEDLNIDLDEGLLVREPSPNLLIGVYPFPGEFINRVRIDFDGALTTCHHMQFPIDKRLALYDINPVDWLKNQEVIAYHKKYWKNNAH